MKINPNAAPDSPEFVTWQNAPLRLVIATQIMAGFTVNRPGLALGENTRWAVQDALHLADALIAEYNEGSKT